jgi:heterodisulfide reductase subunit A-like polyferredoxin
VWRVRDDPHGSGGRATLGELGKTHRSDVRAVGGRSAMSMSRDADVVVIGSGMGGLTAAAYLAAPSDNGHPQPKRSRKGSVDRRMDCVRDVVPVRGGA